jgi:tetratricopeptide (TPR) repeat protein
MTARSVTWVASRPLLIVSLCALSPARASAETVDQAYAAALKHHYAGRYRDAVAGFQRVLAIPVENADLRYNLGCAYFRLGDYGRAVYHFERALQLDPDAEDAAFNLKTVRALLASKVKDELKGALVDPFWMRAVGVMSVGSWGALFLVVWWLTFGILFLLRFIAPGPARSGLVAGNSFVALVALLCGLMLAGRVYHDRRVESAIVLPDTLAVREGPDPSTKTSFRLHAGLKVRVQGREGRWMRIRLPNGLEGWVPTRDVGVL